MGELGKTLIENTRMHTIKAASWGSSPLEWGLGLQVPLPKLLAKVVRAVAVVSALAGLVFTVAYPAGSWQNLAGAVAADMGGTLWLLLWLGTTPDWKLAVNPLTGLLGLYALRRWLGLIFVVSHASSLASPFNVVPTQAYIASSAKAEWITLLGTVAFCCGWVLARRRRSAGGGLTASTAWRDRQLWFAYAVGLAGYLVNWLLPGVAARLGSFFTVTSGLAYGSIFALFAFSTEFGIRGRLRLFTYLALLPLIANVLTFGMKSAFFFALLPVGAAYLLKRPGKGLALSTVALLFLLVFVYPYVQEYREVNWGPNPRGESVGEVARRVQQNISQEGTLHTVKGSWDQFELRFGSVNEAGAVVYFADHTGLVGGFFIRYLLIGFIPRLLWPGKPSWDPSGWFTDFLAGGTGAYVPGASSTALHIAPELYWMYGWLGTLFGMFLLGLFYRKVSDWLLASGTKSSVFWAAWYVFLQFVTFIEEVRFNTAILTPFILLATTVAVSMLVGMLGPRRVGLVHHGSTRMRGGRAGAAHLHREQ